MSDTRATGVVLAAALVLTSAWSTPGRAQGLGAYRGSEPDMLRPYSSLPGRGGGAPSRAYTRAHAVPPPVVRTRAPARQVHDYFPGMRANQSPNRNAVDVRSLCNPGRRALLRR